MGKNQRNGMHKGNYQRKTRQSVDWKHCKKGKAHCNKKKNSEQRQAVTDLTKPHGSAVPSSRVQDPLFVLLELLFSEQL